MPKAPSSREPTLHDPAWLDFIVATERLSDAVDGDWPALRRGFRRLRARGVENVSPRFVAQHLDAFAFHVAVSWALSSRIVRVAFDRVWSGDMPQRVRIGAVAHLFSWASVHSPADLPYAQRVVREARVLAARVEDRQSRRELERMLETVTKDPGALYR